MSDATGALVLLAELPPAKRILGDKGYDADWLRNEPKARSLRVCIPAGSKRRRPATHNRTRQKKQCRIENTLARLKACGGITMRYTLRGDLFLSTIALAAAVIFGCSCEFEAQAARQKG